MFLYFLSFFHNYYSRQFPFVYPDEICFVPDNVEIRFVGYFIFIAITKKCVVTKEKQNRHNVEYSSFARNFIL